MDRILSVDFLKEEMDRIFTKPLASQPLKKTAAQLLLSVSVFSFVCSWPCLESPLTYYERLCYFSWSSMRFLSIAMSKNCIFLICNGILVFLAKTSAFARSPSPSDVGDMLRNKIGDGLQIQTEGFQKHLEECGDVSAGEEGGELECSDEVSVSVEESDDEGDVEFGNRRISDEEEDEGHVINGEEEEGGGNYSEIEKMSTEEVNQKFEEFIRKMKEEFRINEAHQLVMVN